MVIEISGKTVLIDMMIFYPFHASLSICFRNTHREKAPSNKTLELTESVNMDIWVVGTSNQLFIRGSYTETNFPKN